MCKHAWRVYGVYVWVYECMCVVCVNVCGICVYVSKWRPRVDIWYILVLSSPSILRPGSHLNPEPADLASLASKLMLGIHYARSHACPACRGLTQTLTLMLTHWANWPAQIHSIFENEKIGNTLPSDPITTPATHLSLGAGYDFQSWAWALGHSSLWCMAGNEWCRVHVHSSWCTADVEWHRVQICSVWCTTDTEWVHTCSLLLIFVVVAFLPLFLSVLSVLVFPWGGTTLQVWNAPELDPCI